MCVVFVVSVCHTCMDYHGVYSRSGTCVVYVCCVWCMSGMCVVCIGSVFVCFMGVGCVSVWGGMCGMCIACSKSCVQDICVVCI